MTERGTKLSKVQKIIVLEAYIDVNGSAGLRADRF